MFTGTNGASTIVCSPSSIPTSQPTRDVSFKKYIKDEVNSVASNVKHYLSQTQSGLSSLLKNFRRAIQPRGHKEDL